MRSTFDLGISGQIIDIRVELRQIYRWSWGRNVLLLGRRSGILRVLLRSWWRVVRKLGCGSLVLRILILLAADLRNWTSDLPELEMAVVVEVAEEVWAYFGTAALMGFELGEVADTSGLHLLVAC